MKIRYVLVAIVLAASAACQSSPTASRAEDSRSASEVEVRLDGTSTPADSTTTRAGGGGTMGSGG
jgi:hypothetical protein